jgi:hypothetical protein
MRPRRACRLPSEIWPVPTPMDDLERWRDANLVAQRRALKTLEK